GGAEKRALPRGVISRVIAARIPRSRRWCGLRAAGGIRMSLRNRARSLQKKTGLSYQQALARLRALGDRPATLRRQTHWPLEVCDRYLIDGHAPILVQE